ncbi:hypothetical protein HU230_0007975 [Bradyrhizobium quebecense]|uniref:DUF2190 domain-containing protein n=1 Tax=Bradyrhizobium quebecense TaxID=2748629 RepID=A0A973WRU2_9BRAD|nr:hypothetical protein [Bradyrhizobium quebecense]UGA45964.1 hypothetical protein HU230_0007975 [Bradyrhizobium quebecense]
MIPLFIRSYQCSADIPPNTIVKFSDAANSSKVASGAAAADALWGISDRMGGLSGGMADIVIGGLAELKLGGPVAAGDPITSDANGNGIKCVAAAGVVKRVICFAEEPGVLGDVIKVKVAISLLQLPA